MRRKKAEIARIKDILECDRLSVGEDFEGLLSEDLIRTLKDYFDFKCAPSLKIIKSGGVFSVEIKFLAERIKTFGVVPK